MKKGRRKLLSTVLAVGLIVPNFLVNVAPAVSAAEVTATDLIISQYVEPAGGNGKVIEIYNGTADTINLTDYTLEQYTNGNPVGPSTFSLTGELQSGKTAVVYNPALDTEADRNYQAFKTIKDSASAATIFLSTTRVTTFNGNDPIVLKHGGNIIDSIGKFGSADNFAVDGTFIRESSVVTGDTNLADDVILDGQWFKLPANTYDGLGSHPNDNLKPEPPKDEPIKIADARKAAINSTVTIEGIATTNTGLWGGDSFYMQDATAGMFIYGSPQNVKPGDKVKLTGELITYQGELEVKPTSIVVVSSGNPLPTVQSVKVVDDSTQAELLKLENVEITELTKDGYGTVLFNALFESGEKVRVIHDNRTGSNYDEFVKHYKEGDKVHIVGLGSINDSGFHLKTTGLDSYDLVNKPAVYAVQTEGVVPAGTKIELKSGIEGAEIHYTTDGTTPTAASTKYVEPIALQTGETTIKAVAVNGETVSAVFSFTYKILDTTGAKIHDIQGKGHVSDYNGASVTDITGVVTHVFGTSSFVMQDAIGDNDPATSEAIEVSKSGHGVAVGDQVSVNGIVTETGGGANLSTTRLTATAVTKTTDTKAELPAPLVVGKDIIPPNKVIDNDSMTKFEPQEDGIDFWESVEYMRVSFPDALVVGPPYNKDVPIIVESTTNNELNSLGGLNIAADDYNPEKVFLDNAGEDFRSGDRFDGDVIGILTYSSNGYQVVADKTLGLPALIKADLKQEITHIVPDKEKLTVASYNIENFSNNTANTPDAKVAKIAKTFVDNMKSPDIITLIEVQDNDGETNNGNADASQSYERLIKAIETAGGPTYKWTDVEPINNTSGGAPGGNIRVGYLYNPERVTLVQGTKGEAAQANAWTEAGNLTLNPGFVNPSKFEGTRKPVAAEFEFQGQRVVVIGNHLNSKGGDQSLWGSSQPPVLGSEAERIALATEVNKFIKDGLAKNPALNVVVTGDMNDFEFTPALQALKGDILTNMVDLVPAKDRFSYFYQGNNQVLDHILVTKNLVSNTKADMIHINANFTEAQGQASDHDPILVQIDFPDLTIIHTNDTHAALENMPRTVTALKDLRGTTPGALLLHAGDAFTGTLFFNEFKGEADLKLMNLMKFDAMTFGNHEFDLGSSAEGHQKLADFVKDAQFPFVSANVDFSKDAKFDGLFNDSVVTEFENGKIYNGIIKEVNGEKVGIFGLTTEETKEISSPGTIAFEKYIDEAKKAVSALEAQGVNRIVALTHIGYDDNPAIDNDLLLAERVEGIDVIVGGHSHTTLKEPVVVAKDETPTVIVQTGNSNSNLGVVNVEFDDNGVITAHNGKLIAIDPKVIAADPEAVQLLKPYQDKVNEVSNKEIGVSTPIALESPRTNGDNTKPSVRKNETILGNLITDGMLAKAKSFTGKNVIMALQNGGGIRASIDQGPITVGEVITVLPFNNTLATMDVTGAELKAAFETSVSLYPAENGGFLHVSGGKVEFDSTKPAGKRVISVSYLDENGKYVEVKDDVTYTVATNAFTAKGGDGYDMFAKAYAEGRVTDLGLSDWENFRDHLLSIKSEGIPTEVEGRITDGFSLTIMHTNDVHANLKDMPRTITKVKEIRAANANSLLLHAGDQFTGTLYFNEFQGAADLAILKLMGIDAMTFGNHEFDLGSSSEGHQKLVDFIKGANFPFVSANINFSKDAKFAGIYNDSIESAFANGAIYNGIVKNFNGEKVGIFGLTTEETAAISSPGSVEFENYLAEAKKAVQALEAKGVNKIIALTHIGYDDNAAIDNDLTLAKEVEGIDVIVGGHSHTTLSKPTVVAEDATPTLIVQTGNSNSNLGVLNVVFNKNGVITKHDGKLIAIDSKIAEDQEAVEVLAPFKAKVDEISNNKIGVETPIALESPRTNGDNTKPSVRKNETILGNLITDGMLEKAKSFTGKNVIMALQNGGGIRASIDKGPITVGEVITVLPFNNTLATMDLTGAELKAAFEISFGQYPAENGGFLHVSGGKVVFDPTQPAGKRVVSVSYLNEKGQYVELKDDEMYTVATNAFTAKGGDDYDVFAKAYAEGRVTDLGLSDWENFRDHLLSIGSEGIPTEIDGRIIEKQAVVEPAKSGWTQDKDVWYFYKDGVKQTGWLLDKGKWYLLDKTNGDMKTGWQLDKGKWYLLDKTNGDMKTGWQLDKGKWYLLDKTNGDMKTGWQLDNGKWYLLDKTNGDMKTGWQLDKGKWYLLDKTNGDMKTGWQLDKGKWYLLDKTNGDMKTGWQLDKGKWYFLDTTNGDMKTSWIKVNSRWYFLKANGEMQTGWVQVNSKWYYLYENGSMAANTTVQGYKLSADGAWIQ